jgi:hypothetical protein
MKRTPEFKLWLQVMRQGLDDLRHALNREAKGLPAGEVNLEELRIWIFEDQGPGSFEWLCDALDVDAARARGIVRAYWSRRLGGERVRLGLRRITVCNGRMRVRMAAVRVRPRREREMSVPAGQRSAALPAA